MSGFSRGKKSYHSFLILNVQKDPPNLWKHLLIVRPEMISLTALMLWYEPNSRMSIICLLIFIRMKLFTGGKRQKHTANKNYRDLWQHLYTSRKSKVRQHQPFSARRASPRLRTPPISQKIADIIGQKVFEKNAKQKICPVARLTLFYCSCRFIEDWSVTFA